MLPGHTSLGDLNMGNIDSGVSISGGTSASSDDLLLCTCCANCMRCITITMIFCSTNAVLPWWHLVCAVEKIQCRGYIGWAMMALVECAHMRLSKRLGSLKLHLGWLQACVVPPNNLFHKHSICCMQLSLSLTLCFINVA